MGVGGEGNVWLEVRGGLGEKEGVKIMGGGKMKEVVWEEDGLGMGLKLGVVR